jgi:two-component system, sensor histidine kinase
VRIVFPPVSTLAAVGLSYFLTGALATRAFGTLSPIWYSNAIVLVALLRHPPRSWWAFLVAGGLADMAAIGWFGQGSPFLVAMCDMVEVALAAVLIARSGGLTAPLFAGRQMLRIMVVCALAPIATSALGALLLQGWHRDAFLAAWRTWYSATALGLVTVTPFLLSWADRDLRRDNLGRVTGRRMLVLGLGTLLAAAVAYQHWHPALLFLEFPLVFGLTWLFGLAGATAGMVAVMAGALAAALYGPYDVFSILMPQGAVERRIEAVQLYLLAILMSSLPVAVLRSQQRELLGQLRRVGNARGEFLAAMSHEIRTPMTGVLGMADLLAQEPLTGRQRKYLEAMQGSGRHLLSVINDILDFSRLESGRLELESIDFHVAEVVEGTRSLMHPLAVERGLQLRIDIAPAVQIPLRGDPLRVRQVLLNLVGNAVKFTEHGSVTVRVSGHASDHPQQVRVLFEVRDTGVGIEEARLAHLFAPFAQADASTTRQFGGSGLGLAISKRLVEAMGGTIGASSRSGAGSTFYFEVPLALGEPEAVTDDAAAQAAPIVPRRILVAEDVEINRDLLQAALARQGHDVVFAVNGAEAVELARDHDFDIVLMDVQMPVLDGVAATRRIRELPAPRGTVPIVGLTANVMARERALYLGAGMDDCLGKPIQWDQLRAALARLGGTAPTAPAPFVAAETAPLIEDRAIDGLRAIMQGAALARLLEQGIAGHEAACARLLEPASPAQFQREAHGIKGSAATLGLARVSAIAARIEAIAPQDADRVPGMARELRQALADSRRALAERELLPSRAPA